MKLSKNFDLSEMTRSSTASRNNIENNPTPCQIAAGRLVALEVMQPIRDFFGPVSPSSWFRSVELNNFPSIRGSKTSQHLLGEAVDFEVPGVDNYEVADWIMRSSIPFDQLILEFYVKGQPSSGWIHISHAAARTQRGEVKSAVRGADGGRRYLDGLIAD